MFKGMKISLLIMACLACLAIAGVGTGLAQDSQTTTQTDTTSTDASQTDETQTDATSTDTTTDDSVAAENSSTTDTEESMSGESTSDESSATGDMADDEQSSESVDEATSEGDMGNDAATEGAMATEDTLSQEQEADLPVVLSLGDTNIGLREFNDRFRVFMSNLASSQGVNLTEDMLAQLASVKPRYLEQLAADMVLVQEAKNRDLSLSDEEVDAIINDIKTGLPDPAVFDEITALAGFRNEAQLRSLLGEVESIQRVISALEGDIEISEAEVESFYNDNIELFKGEEEVCASHILLESLEDAQAVLDSLEAGADFAELAAEKSIGPSAPRGGDLDCFSAGMMVPAFEEAAFAAEVGSVVGPVETEFGQHIILVREHRGLEPQPLEVVAADIRQELSAQQLNEKIAAMTEASGVITYPEALLTEVVVPETTSDEAASDESTNADDSSTEAAEDDATMEDSEDTADDTTADTTNDEATMTDGDASDADTNSSEEDTDTNDATPDDSQDDSTEGSTNN